jgi:hypothetical protein
MGEGFGGSFWPAHENKMQGQRDIGRQHNASPPKPLKRPHLEHSFIGGTPFAGALLRLLVLLVLIAAALPAAAQPLARATTLPPLKREILALYDGREEPRPDQTRIHRFAEMPLNYLGFVLTYWDVSASLPRPEQTANSYGAISWFRRAQPGAFYLWARDLMVRGSRMVVLGDGGLAAGEAPPEEANQLFEQIGFRMSGGYIDLTYGTHVLHRDALIGFEQKLDPSLPGFPVVGTIGAAVASHLVLESRDAGATLASSVVLTSPRGGYAASGYLLYEEPISGRTKWITDPFAFFRKAFSVPVMPIPDVTTLSGRRIYFSHIDGDGWNNVSRIEAYHDKQTISAEVVLRELIASYPDLPVSVGVIGADVDERYGPVETARRVTRELFALPQVEVATHSYTHPYQWPFFENYDRDLEERILGNGESDLKGILGDRALRLVQRFIPSIAPKNRGEGRAQDDDPPRAYADFPFDADQEFRSAVQAAEGLAPPGKRTALYLWSGGAEPYEDAIAQTRKLGVRNMNGGDSRYDPDFPSISYLSPVSRPVGAERQIYAGNANDYLYITDGTGRDHGYLNLEATFNATETPRRLKPMNVYYHMFAGERAAQLAAVRHHLDAARAEFVTPVAASHYAAIADGFFSTEITALDRSSWLIRRRGALGTVRFDDAAGIQVDFARSTGVLGQRRKDNSLYVSLDEAHEDVVLAIARVTAIDAGAAIPHLVHGRWVFRDLRRSTCGFTVEATGYGPGQMTWGGMTPGLYHVTVRDAEEMNWETDVEVGEDRRMSLTAEVDALRPVFINAACQPAGGG